MPQNDYCRCTCGVEITDVACGAEHTIACSESGEVYGFGSNRFSQLGVLRPAQKAVLEVMSPSRPNTSSTRSSSRKRKRKKNGKNSPGSPKNVITNGKDKNDKYCLPQLINTGDFSEAKNIYRVAAGGKHSVFITKEGNIYGCGESGYNGRMGHMTNSKQYVPRKVKYLRKRLKKNDKIWQGKLY